MEIENRRKFIINFTYFAIIIGVVILLLKYLLPLITPFVIAFVLAFLLKRPIRFVAKTLRIRRKVAGFVVVLVFYSTIGVLISMLGIKLVYGVSNLVNNLPNIYSTYLEPTLDNAFNTVEKLTSKLDPKIIQVVKDFEEKIMQSVGDMVTGISVTVMENLISIASSLPGLFIKMVLMIISTFFIAADYDKITDFMLGQLRGKGRVIFEEVEKYVVGTLFVCLRSYLLIMTITFLELSVGLSIVGINNAILVALLISIFDILPVLGTGGIMIPWVVLEFLQQNVPLALGLLIIYLAITIIRNIIEPKIVGKQIGLHPVVTLASMFVGLQLFGFIGLFGFPIGISLIRHLDANGTINIFRKPEKE